MPSDEAGDLEVVLSTGDKARLALAKSLLDSADIKYSVQGDIVQDMFVEGRLGLNYNPLTGPVRLWVSAEEAQSAKAILAELPEPRARVLPLPIRVIAGLFLASMLASLIYQIITWIR